MFPIIGIVLLLCFTIAPISPSVLLCFLMGAVLILVGMMFFTLGAEMSMTPMGERIGTCLTRSRQWHSFWGLSSPFQNRISRFWRARCRRCPI